MVCKCGQPGKQRSSEVICRECRNARERRRYHSKPMTERAALNHRNYIKHKTAARSGQLKRLYGITLETYNQMFESQQGACLLCNTHQSQLKTALHVDHDHESGKVRGLLCFECNKRLGRYETIVRAGLHAAFENYILKAAA